MAGKHGMSYSSRPNMAARSAHRQGAQQFRRYDTTPIRPKKSKGPVIFAIILILLVLGGVGFFAMKGCNDYGPYTEVATGESITVNILEGAYTGEIADTLQQGKVIGSAREFVDRATKRGLENSLKPGTYVLVGGTSVDELIDQLVAGPDTLSVVIPEGTTLANVAKTVQSATDGQISAKSFLKCAKNAKAYQDEYPFLKDAYDNSMEGFLFPKTYSVAVNDDADSLVRKMLDQYLIEVDSLDYSAAKKAGLDEYDVLVLASIIERESTDEVRDKVSSVFYNRLKIDMPLQSDATTAYVIGGDPTPDDLKKKGPFNTYLNKGLTPGPICNPGLASLEAACAPASTKYLYFYFVPDKDGKMKYYFSKTYEEHLNAIANG